MTRGKTEQREHSVRQGWRDIQRLEGHGKDCSRGQEAAEMVRTSVRGRNAEK